MTKKEKSNPNGLVTFRECSKYREEMLGKMNNLDKKVVEIKTEMKTSRWWFGLLIPCMTAIVLFILQALFA